MPITRPAVKICGITNLADAMLAAELGADYLGYIVNYPASPRFIEASRARGIIQSVRRTYPHVQHVGVVVDNPPRLINALVNALGVDVVQLHGNETIEDIQSIRNTAVWKALELHTVNDTQYITEYDGKVEGILLDSGKGSGKEIDDQLLHHQSLQSLYILAGGITPGNVLHKILTHKPDIIDFNSGIESAPGKKDAKMLRDALAKITTL